MDKFFKKIGIWWDKYNVGKIIIVIIVIFIIYLEMSAILRDLRPSKDEIRAQRKENRL